MAVAPVISTLTGGCVRQRQTVATGVPSDTHTLRWPAAGRHGCRCRHQAGAHHPSAGM